jgi:hypothetical protein
MSRETRVNFLKHDLILVLTEASRKPIKRIQALKPWEENRGGEWRKLLTNDEKYVVNVLLAAMRIVDIIDQLRAVPVFLRNFPRRGRFRQYGINHLMYLRYHLEMHFIKTATLLDQMAILMNHVFRLGFPEKRCTIEAIIENDNTKNTSAARKMKMFGKSIEGIKSVRNRIVHHGILKDEDFDELAPYYFLSENLGPENDLVIPDSFLKQITKDAMGKKLRLVTQNNEAIDEIVSDFFASLVPEFEKRSLT